MVSRGDIMQPCSVEFDFMMRNLRESGTLRRDLHKLLLILENPLRFIFNVFTVPIREESEVIRNSAPATAHSFLSSLFYCVLLATFLLCDRAHLTELNGFVPHH